MSSSRVWVLSVRETYVPRQWFLNLLSNISDENFVLENARTVLAVSGAQQSLEAVDQPQEHRLKTCAQGTSMDPSHIGCLRVAEGGARESEF